MSRLSPDRFAWCRWFATRPIETKLAIIATLTDEEAMQLRYTWTAWARDKQLVECECGWDWTIWLILAGRGFGKTRTGAELVIEWAAEDPHARIALVGRTAADVRDVMVEGESGILAVSPPWFRPKYEPSKRRLTWPNGAMATTYSADEPDALRGPQHSKAWGDECLIAGTMIQTVHGEIPIENIRVGDLVHTRNGLRRVKHAGLTNPSATVYELTASDGRKLVGTANHPIFVQNKGFKPLHSVSSGDIMIAWNNKKLNQASSGMDAVGGSTENIIAIVEENCCIEPSMRLHTEASPLVWKSITETGIKPTTISATSRPSHVQNISSSIALLDGKSGTKQNEAKWFGRNGKRKNHISRTANIAGSHSLLQGHVHASVGQTVEQQTDVETLSKCLHKLVSSVGNHSCSTIRQNAIALLLADMKQRDAQRNLVLYAVQSSMSEPAKPSAVQENAHTCTTVKVKSVQIYDHNRAVFNLEVEDCPEFFANGILVHNCGAWKYTDTHDQLMFGLRLGRKPQAVYTTTPRATKFIKGLSRQKTTHVTKGTTYENLNNLAPTFRQQVIGRYEGTRLGRQELEGIILDDNERALWKREPMIEALRVLETPQFKRIVVGVDPSVHDGTDPDNKDLAECGIIVGGLGIDDDGYLLDDKSLMGSPMAWAKEAVTALRKNNADRIVAEINNGGALVEIVIRVIDKNVPYKHVRAAHGKLTRAEPISSLAEQGRIHHVGTFPDVEDQLCNWEAGMKSPDRLDAYVWTFTELMLDDSGDGGVISLAALDNGDDEDNPFW